MTNYKVPYFSAETSSFEPIEVHTSSDVAGAIVSDYIDSIRKAAVDETFTSRRPNDTAANDQGKSVQILYNSVDDGKIHDFSTGSASSVLIYGKLPGEGTRSLAITNERTKPVTIVDAADDFGQVAVDGTAGGTYVATEGSRALLLDKSKGDWTISLTTGSTAGVDDLGKNHTGLNRAVENALQSSGNVVALGSGTNHLTLDGDARNLIGLGSGKNYLEVNSANASVYGGGFTSTRSANVSSNEQLFATNNNFGTDIVTINAGGGNFDLGKKAFVVDAAKVGSVIRVQDDSSVTGGQGSTVVFDDVGGTGTIMGAIGDTISAAGNLTVMQGKDLEVSVSGALNFVGGTGNAVISGEENSTVWGAQGLNAKAEMNGRTIFTDNQGGFTGDQTIDASASKGNLEFWSGPGDSVFKGGSGNNHLVFGTAFDGVSGASNATVTGGTGANSFGVLAGHGSGNITITDFDASKGDFFFEYFYKPTNAAQAVNDLLSTAKVSDGNTTIQLDHNMQVTFIGVTHLDASAIRIS